jgi:hypothetical protein
MLLNNLSFRKESEVLLSTVRVSIDTMTVEKGVMDFSGEDEKKADSIRVEFGGTPPTATPFNGFWDSD